VILRKTRSAEQATAAAEDAPAGEVLATGTKGRPTPKRRESEGRRGPVTAPKTRKEAMARQRELAKEARGRKLTTPAKSMTVAQRREALKAGDPAFLPRRDQGRTRALARDYVDSRRMISSYMLLLFPLMILGAFVPLLSLVTLALFFVFLYEWYAVGRRIRTMAIERHGKSDGGSAMSIGFYAGSRAYLPRRWRLPAPRVARGDPI
jgi:hypothetical protein